MTGVVLKALYATAPVSRRVRLSVTGSTVTTCTCDIWSCGMIKSCGVADLEAFEENDVIWLACSPSFEWQAVSITRQASAIVHGMLWPAISRFFMAGSWFLRLREAVRARASTLQVPVCS